MWYRMSRGREKRRGRLHNEAGVMAILRLCVFCLVSSAGHTMGLVVCCEGIVNGICRLRANVRLVSVVLLARLGKGERVGIVVN
jgi:hypothetical protein